jgi:hypothetical protein
VRKGERSRDLLLNDVFDGLVADRFGDEIIATGSQSGVAVGRHRVLGHADDHGVFAERVLAQGAHEIQAGRSALGTRADIDKNDIGPFNRQLFDGGGGVWVKQELVVKPIRPQQNGDLFKGELAVPVTFDICYMQHPILIL